MQISVNIYPTPSPTPNIPSQCPLNYILYMYVSMHGSPGLHFKWKDKRKVTFFSYDIACTTYTFMHKVILLKDICHVWYYFVGWDKMQSFTKLRPFQKQCQSSIQCAGIRYPRSSEHPLIPASLFTGGQVATLNGFFHGQTGHLPNMANTKASERQIFNWSTSELQRQYQKCSWIYWLYVSAFGLWYGVGVRRVFFFNIFILCMDGQ